MWFQWCGAITPQLSKNLLCKKKRYTGHDDLVSKVLRYLFWILIPLMSHRVCRTQKAVNVHCTASAEQMSVCLNNKLPSTKPIGTVIGGCWTVFSIGMGLFDRVCPHPIAPFQHKAVVFVNWLHICCTCVTQLRYLQRPELFAALAGSQSSAPNTLAMPRQLVSVGAMPPLVVKRGRVHASPCAKLHCARYFPAAAATVSIDISHCAAKVLGSKQCPGAGWVASHVLVLRHMSERFAVEIKLTWSNACQQLSARVRLQSLGRPTKQGSQQLFAGQGQQVICEDAFLSCKGFRCELIFFSQFYVVPWATSDYLWPSWSLAGPAVPYGYSKQVLLSPHWQSGATFIINTH
jgi:hypothetical protein